MKLQCLKFLESSVFENASFFLISSYTLFILFWLTLADLLSITDEFLSDIDMGFLYIFLGEIVMKSFASNFMYLLDFFNFFDACIVCCSLVLGLVGII